MCCSIRDKEGRGGRFPFATDSPQFECSEVALPLEQPRFLAFAPLWQGTANVTRRIALASSRTVKVFRMPDTYMPAQDSSLQHEYSLELEEDSEITALLFRDEDSSRNLIVAYGPPEGAAGHHVVRVWSCDAVAVMLPWPEPAPSPQIGGMAPAAPAAVQLRQPTLWSAAEGFVSSLEDHTCAVSLLAVSSTYLLTADVGGECRVWQKTRGLASRAVARLHQGGIADLAVDRLFAYSAGRQELAVRIWSVPDLKAVLTITADMLESRCVLGTADPAASTLPCKLVQLTAVRRPTSRWSGAQGSTRHSGAPRGTLYVAGITADGRDVAGGGAAVLMEWSLGAQPTLQSAQVAHDTAIVVLAYGPYDNGPLVTGDTRGIFRVWDCTPRLLCSQQVEAGTVCETLSPAVVVDPQQRALYTIVGDSRLFVWRQHGAFGDLA